ncbi:MFS transporter [Streptomyces sp. NPDC020379]|uniref:MFS transporter n=1 Tax=Streptomyces sp. NPDC020379 TaxID=3365071 RepID=UPI0037AF6D78
MTAAEPADALTAAESIPTGSLTAEAAEVAVAPVAPEVTGPVPDPDPAQGVLGRSYRALTFGIISVVSLIAFEASAVNTAMPVAARALDGVGLYAFSFSAFFTASLFAMTLSGEWCDRTGPLAPLFTGIAAFGAGLVVAGSAQRMWMFVAGRGIQGIGGGLVLVALYVVVGRAYPERLRPSIVAAFSAAWVVPVIVGPLVAGTVTEHIGWRWVFLSIPVLILLPLAVMLPALRALPAAERAPAMDRRRILLALAVAAGAGLLQYAGQDLRWVALVPAAAGLGMLAPAVLRLLPRGTLRAARGLPSVVLLRGIAAGAFLGTESFIPLMLVTERGMSATTAGLSLTGGGLTWALGSYTQSRPRLEAHRERLMTLGMLLVAAAVALASTALIDGVPAWIVAASWIVGGYGMGLTISGGSVLLLKLSRPGEEGADAASLQISDALGNITLVGVGGVLFAALGGGAGGDTAAPHAAFVVVFLTMAAAALVGAYVTTRLRPRTQALRGKRP